MRRTFVTVTLLSLVLAPLGATASATDEETFQKLMNKVAPKSTDLINKFKPRNACACMSDVPPSPGIVVQDNSGDVRCGKLGFNVDGSVGSIIFCNDFEVLGR